MRTTRERNIAQRITRDEEIMDREIREAAAAYFQEVEHEAQIDEEVQRIERNMPEAVHTELQMYNSSNERNLLLRRQDRSRHRPSEDSEELDRRY